MAHRIKKTLFYHSKTMGSRLKNLLIAKLIRLMAKTTFDRSPVGLVHTFLNVLATIFFSHFSQFYSVASAEYLSEKILGVREERFARLMILNKLMSKYIQIALHDMSWKQTLSFLDRNCKVITGGQHKPAKLLLCTHTGDYWLAILGAARQYQGSGCDFIVPVYQAITDDLQQMYNKISIPGVNIIFINIHQKGMLLKLNRSLRDEDSVVAIFYDLFGYSAGVYNGATESVEFFNKKGQMTTGIVNVAKRLGLAVSFVSCFYASEEEKYLVEITPPVQLTETQEATKGMLAFLEGYLRTTPWQWSFISSLDAYYHLSLFSLNAKNSREASHFARLNDKYSHRL
ncbi:hypothetical protein ACMGGR_11530 [Erwinia sp. BNK-24-b]|uniref:LpxL/LpxP family acyltransferase n=1 Tax=unclassified Erwinia TaxID=2622719 RepID=UPI0039BF56AA